MESDQPSVIVKMLSSVQPQPQHAALWPSCFVLLRMPSPHRRPLDLAPLRSADVCLLTGLSRFPGKKPQDMVRELLTYIEFTIKRGGSVRCFFVKLLFVCAIVLVCCCVVGGMPQNEISLLLLLLLLDDCRAARFNRIPCAWVVDLRCVIPSTFPPSAVP